MSRPDYLEILNAPTSEIEPLSDAERHILRSAITVFGRRGYTGSSVRHIAEQAGVTAPLIGYHFGNKEGLFSRCVEVVMGGLDQAVLEAVAEDDGIVDAVRRLVRVFFDFSHSHPDALRFVLTVVYGPEHGQPHVEWLRHYAAIWQWSADRFRRAIDEGELRPRSGATVPLLLRHLFHIVHLEVLTVYERERFAEQLRRFAQQVEAAEPDLSDPVEDVVIQFFQGAGEVTSGSEGESRST